MNLLHKNKNDDDNNIENEEEEKPNKMILYSVIYLSSFLTPNLQFNASSKKKKPFYSQESSDQPTTSQVELEKK
uniref:Uncharacterized protein n=1 Tax=Glycine max TaxID=3847 RepID=C6T4M0_SOYBN|nr:unknown [Glycine max]